MSDERLYFAYGSNINLTQMEYRCPDATPLVPVMLHGYELTFRGGGVAKMRLSPASCGRSRRSVKRAWTGMKDTPTTTTRPI